MNSLLDVVWIVATLVLACAARDAECGSVHELVAVVAVASYAVAASYLDLYRSSLLSSLPAEIARVWLAWTATVVVVALVGHVVELLPGPSEPVLLLWFTAGYGVLGLARLALNLALRYFCRHGSRWRTAALVGATGLAGDVSRVFEHNAWMGVRLIGSFDDRKKPGRLGAVPNIEILGNFDDLVREVRDGRIDLLYVTLPMRAELRFKDLVDRLKDTTVSVYYVPDLSGFDLLNARWDTVGDIPIINVVDSPFNGLNAPLKRLFDLCAGSVFLIVAAVPMVVIAACIRFTSPGPAIFRQWRYGLNGKKFQILKFRTMTVCEDGAQFHQAVRDDPRVTALGCFLRRTSLDELPQLINVLLGDMSIVGPRPHPVAMNEEQRGVVESYMWRHKVRPGITGWAQVNGFRGETDTLEKIQRRIQFDLEYIDNWSLWLDIRIIVKTAWVLFERANAY